MGEFALELVLKTRLDMLKDRIQDVEHCRVGTCVYSVYVPLEDWYWPTSRQFQALQGFIEMGSGREYADIEIREDHKKADLHCDREGPEHIDTVMGSDPCLQSICMASSCASVACAIFSHNHSAEGDRCGLMQEIRVVVDHGLDRSQDGRASAT